MWKLGWEVKCYNSSPFRLLLGKPNGRTSQKNQMLKFPKKIQNALFQATFSPNMSKNEFSAKIRLCQFLDNKKM